MRYYGSMDSDRRKTEATCNGPNYGHIRGWDAGVKVIPDWSAPQKRDELAVYMTGGSNGSSQTRLIGTVKDTEHGPRWEPADEPGQIPASADRRPVIAAIPVGSHLNSDNPGEYVCVVVSGYWPSGEPRFAVVHVRSEDGTWITVSHSDYWNAPMSQTEAMGKMIQQAGHVTRSFEDGKATRERELAELHPDDRQRIFDAYDSARDNQEA
jgi:hypothetical protein